MGAQSFPGRFAMNRFVLGACLTVGVISLSVAAQDSAPDKPEGRQRFEPFKPESVTSSSSVTIDGHAIGYDAIAGTLVVHPKDWDDVPRDPNADKSSDEGESKNPTAVASVFYVAYFKNSGGKGSAGKGDNSRPITFLFNGGPGSATLWLHMGAF